MFCEVKLFSCSRCEGNNTSDSGFGIQYFNSMNRMGNKGTLCPLFCCFFWNSKCCCVSSDEDDDDPRRALIRKHRKLYRKYTKRTKPRDISKVRLTNSGRFVDTYISQSPVIHSGLKRLPFNGTLSDLTERSEEESVTASMTNLEEMSLQFEEQSLMFSGIDENHESETATNTKNNAMNTKPGGTLFSSFRNKNYFKNDCDTK